MRHPFFAAFMAAALVVGFLAPQATQSSPFISAAVAATPATGESKKEIDKVGFRLSWVHDLAYAGLYLAKDNGHFSTEGMDVTLSPGGFGLDPIKQVATGADQFGIAGANNLLLARAQQIPVVAIGVYFQRNGVAFVTRKDSGIISFRQFKGKRVGLQTGTDTDTVYRMLLVKNGMTPGDVREVPIQYDMAPFLTNLIDVLPGYVTNQPITLRNKGIDVNVITADSEGLHIYGSVFFTSEKLIKDRPDLVARFMRALQRGWQDAFDHKDMTIAAAKRWAPEFDATILPQIYDAAMPLIQADIPGVPINGMDDERWRTTMRAMRDSGLLKDEVDLTRAYTKQFVK
jgi:ABC-type nitrate/sulfonate/bicarbonate transport system substrate-binding protein